jgi:hypothetical protein
MDIIWEKPENIKLKECGWRLIAIDYGCIWKNKTPIINIRLKKVWLASGKFWLEKPTGNSILKPLNMTNIINVAKIPDNFSIKIRKKDWYTNEHI